jgi:iron(III) transport system ATP-binding protein
VRVETLLSVRGLSKAFFGRVVLDSVDLTVPTGSITAVLGPSGAGKTTLLRIVAGFEDADAGTVTMRGTTLVDGSAGTPAERRHIGLVPQEGALFPHLSVGQNIGFGLPRRSQRRIDECLDLVGLAGMAPRRPHELSGGQQQRVALARALAPEPPLIVLDEPFSSLDAGLRAQVRDDVVAVLRRAGTTALLVTHDQQEALAVADQVAVLLDGAVAQAGQPEAVYRHPASLAVATFVGAAGTVGTVPATVTATTFLGHEALVALRLADGREVRARVHLARMLHPGTQVGVAVEGPVAVFGPTSVPART